MSPILIEILKKRGIEDLEKFFNPSVSDLAKSEDLPGAVAAAGEILAAVADKKEIIVFGDYDCDGVCATAILMKTLSALGASVFPFLPDRLSEGYGMTPASVERMLREYPGVELVVTVDNGINSVEEIAELKKRGISVVVTDHHLPGEELPACTIVNPKVNSPKELDGLCGAGVAFFLAGRIISVACERGIYSGGSVSGPLIVLAGLATVTDIMPLIGQNRILVSEALKSFRARAPIGLKELHERGSRTATSVLASKDFGFILGPRINAVGRLASGMDALELLLAEDREIARESARIVDLKNTDRKAIEQSMTDEAMTKIVAGAAAQVIELPKGHQGVAGIVASKVLEKLESPVPVGVVVGSHGSARAPEGYNLRDAFVASSAALGRFGGHAAAGGFSVPDGKIDEFRELFCKACAAQAVNVPEKKELAFDAEPTPADLTVEFGEDVSRMEPFGEGNKEPVFLFRSVPLKDVRPLGGEGRHLLATINGFKAIWWNHGEEVERLRSEGGLHNVRFTVEISEFHGDRHLELRIISL